MRRPNFLPISAVFFAALLGIAALAQTGSRGIDPANMCTTCNACEDFYTYANGGWLAKNEIRPRFGVGNYEQPA
jgi:putative endopeptidase